MWKHFVLSPITLIPYQTAIKKTYHFTACSSSPDRLFVFCICLDYLRFHNSNLFFLTCTVSVLRDTAPCSPCSAPITSDSAGSASESGSGDDGFLLPDFPLDGTGAIKQDKLIFPLHLASLECTIIKTTHGNLR